MDKKQYNVKDTEMPYFFINKEWYYYDGKEKKYKLTDKATKEAIQSYYDFYANLQEDS